MDLKAVAVLIWLSAFAISSTQAVIPGCCVTTRKNIPLKVLEKVIRWTVQSSGGACDINAVILHVKDKSKRICVDQTVFNDLMARLKQWRMKLWKQKVKKRAAQHNA